MIQCGAKGVHRFDECVVGSRAPVPRFAEDVVRTASALRRCSGMLTLSDTVLMTAAAISPLCLKLGDHDETFAGAVDFFDFDAPACIGCVEADGESLLLSDTEQAPLLAVRQVSPR